MVSWFAYSIGTHRVLPLPDGEHLLRPPGTSADRMRIVVSGAQCQVSPSTASFQVQQLAPSPDHVWVSHLIATPDSVLMIIKGDDGVPFAQQALGAIDWLVGVMNDEDSAFIGWRHLHNGEALEACSIERSVFDDVVSGTDESIAVFQSDAPGWCVIDGLIDERVDLLMVSPTWFPAAQLREAPSTESPRVESHVEMDSSIENEHDSADSDDSEESDDETGQHIDAFLNDLREQARPAGSRSVAVDRIAAAGTSTAPTWAPTDGPVAVVGENADLAGARLIGDLMRGRTSHQVHLHLLSDRPMLAGFGSLAHAGAWCTDADISTVRRALAIFDTEISRRERQAVGDSDRVYHVLDIVVIGGFAHWHETFSKEHHQGSTQRLLRLVESGPQHGFAVVLIDSTDAGGDAAAAILSRNGLLGLTRINARDAAEHVTESDVSTLLAGLNELVASPDSPGRAPQRLRDLPSTVPFVALSTAKLERGSLDVPVGLDVNRRVVSLHSGGPERVSYIVGAQGNGRTNLLAVIAAASAKAGVVVYRGNADFDLIADQSGTTAIAVVEADRVPADELDRVLGWAARRSAHHVVIATDDAWWTAHRTGSPAQALRYDGTAARLDGADGGTEIRIADAPKEKL